MKKLLQRFIAPLVLSVTLLPLLSGCTVESNWWSDPGSGWGYNDPRLAGNWVLVQYNSDNVAPGQANYLQFDGRGYGYYFYYDRGYLDRERLRYWCQNSVSGTSYYQINIQYEYSNPLTTNYWFTHGNNTLWMQWRAGGTVQTYVYDRIDYIP